MRNPAAALAITAVLVMAGCSSMTIEVTSTPAGETVETSEAEARTPAPAEEPALEGDTAGYLEQARSYVDRVAELSDEELLALAAEACRQFDAGAARNEIELFEEDPEDTTRAAHFDSMMIGAFAARAFCTDYDA